MRCPYLEGLPISLPGKTGWPWTKESPQLPDTMPNGPLWPRISIVTPGLNQGQFIEETIRSVLLQGYPNLEYIIIDGGSTDDSVDIIKKYIQWLAYWITEPDRGQSHAINKGLTRATGEILAYINSDDLYEPGAFKKIAKIFMGNETCLMVSGSCLVFDEHNDKTIFKPNWPDHPSELMGSLSSTIPQPAVFWRKDAYKRAGGFEEKLNYSFDHEFFIRIGRIGGHPELIPDVIARYRDHAKSKTRTFRTKFYDEQAYIVRKHGKACGLSSLEIKQKIKRIEIEKDSTQVFISWKQKGRKEAIGKYLNMIMRYPNFIFQRHVLGLGRRLLLFKYSDVKELNKF